MSNLYTGLRFDEFEPGAVLESPARTVTEADIVNYAGLSGDFNPLHMDAVFAAQNTPNRRIAHGALTLALSAGLFNRFVDGTCVAFLELTARYTKYVFPGDTLHIRATVAEKNLASKGDKGVVNFDVKTLNQDGDGVLEGRWTLLIHA